MRTGESGPRGPDRHRWPSHPRPRDNRRPKNPATRSGSASGKGNGKGKGKGKGKGNLRLPHPVSVPQLIQINPLYNSQ